jgi:anti-sigma B factor antagonist
VLEVGGEIDLSTAPPLRGTVERLLQDGARAIVADLQDVSFMDSSGLSVLVASMRQTNEAGGRFAVVCTNESILKVFSVTGLDRLFTLVSSVGEATRA